LDAQRTVSLADDDLVPVLHLGGERDVDEPVRRDERVLVGRLRRVATVVQPGDAQPLPQDRNECVGCHVLLLVVLGLAAAPRPLRLLLGGGLLLRCGLARVDAQAVVRDRHGASSTEITGAAGSESSTTIPVPAWIDWTTPGSPGSPFREASHSASVPTNPLATATS